MLKIKLMKYLKRSFSINLILPISENNPNLLKNKINKIIEKIKNDPESIYNIRNELYKNSNNKYRICLSIKNNDVLKQLNDIEIPTKPIKKHILSFIYTGQGSQYSNIALSLYNKSKDFKNTLDYCSKSLYDMLNPSLIDVLYSNSDLINDTKYTQPILYSIEYSLSKLLLEFNIIPDIVMGHSVGEYVAATVSNIFNLDDGLKLISYRSKLISDLPYNIGGMLVIYSNYDKINLIINNYESLSVAAINGPNLIVISGLLNELKLLEKELKNNKIKSKYLQVSHAFHSKLLQPVLKPFSEYTKEIKYNKPNKIIISNVTGNTEKDIFTQPDYWVNHVISPVLFEKSIKKINELKSDIILEIGPKSVLINMSKRCIKNKNINYLSLLYKDKNSIECILEILCYLYNNGYNVNWNKINELI